MKNSLAKIGKKLNKKELKFITGGLLNCIEPTPTFARTRHARPVAVVKSPRLHARSWNADPTGL